MKIMNFATRLAHPAILAFGHGMGGLLRSRCLGWVWGLLLACSLASVAHASAWTFREGVAGYAGTVDTQLRAASPTSAYSSASTVLVDQSDGGAPVVGLLRFDHIVGNGANQIPVAELGYYSAVLVLRTTAANANSSGTVRLHRVLQDWSEDCTWAGCFGGNGVQANGIEVVATPDATFTPNFPDPGGSPANTRQIQIDVTTSIEAWLNGAPNYGWALIMDNPDGYLFDSSESTIITNRPQLQVYYGDPGPTVIVQQPIASTNVTQCRSFSLSVTAIGLGPLIYEWTKDGFSMGTNGNAQTLTIASAQLSDSGTYTVTVSGPGGAVQSEPAVVMVTEDNTAPTVVRVWAEADLTNIVVTFNEPMRPMTSPEEIQALRSAYFIQNDLGLSPAVYTNYFQDSTNLIVALAQPRHPNDPLTLTILGPADGTPLFDACNQTYDNAAAFGVYPVLVEYLIFSFNHQFWKFEASGTDLGTAWKETNFNDSAWLTGAGIFDVNGSIPREEVAGQKVGTVLPLRNTSTWTNANIPTYYFRKEFSLPNPYGSPSWYAWCRLRYLVDDAAVIYLNGEEVHRVGLPAGSAGSYTNYSQDLGQPSPVTPAIADYLLVRVKPGRNVLAVALKNFNATSSDATFGMELLQAGEIVHCDGCIEITAQPQNVQVQEGRSFFLRVAATWAESYQWYKDGAPIPGATNAYLNNPHAHLRDAGKYRVRVSNGWGSSEESQEATVTVIPDQAPPFLLGIEERYGHPEALLLSFAKTNLWAFWELERAAAENLTNYLLTPPVAIVSAVVTNGTNVLLQTAARDPLTTYTLTIRDIRDAAGQTNLLAPNPTTRQFLRPRWLVSFTNQWKYWQAGAELDRAWQAPAYDDSGWLAGQGLFAVGETTADTLLRLAEAGRVHTELAGTAAGTNNSVITYFSARLLTGSRHLPERSSS